LEMDDDDEREFSRSIVFGFFEQAEETFSNMADALKEDDLAALGLLGHFLKGSSATLGMTKVKDACEKIENLGRGKKESDDKTEVDDAKKLSKIKETIVVVKTEYKDAEKRLKAFYHDTS